MLLKTQEKLVVPSVWMLLWAISFSITWLLPVNFPPWNTFPLDAWAALFLGIVGIAIAFRVHRAIVWNGISKVIGLAVFLPFIQFFFGVIPYFGQAWISSIYLFGFLLAFLLGSHWENACPYQLASGLFTAIGIAAILSVGLQLYTWLGLWDSGNLGMWSLAQTGDRPSANLGQPNQLATLLIWGLFSFAWAYVRRTLQAGSAIAGAVFLLFGLALTQSRTGFLALTVVVLVTWVWRKLWPSRSFIRVIAGLYLFFLTCPLLIRWLSHFLLLDQEGMYGRIHQSKEIRLTAWNVFIHAILERPWFGYGWTEVSSAQMAVAEKFPTLEGIFTHSHNLFLDLILWNGLLIGLLMVGVIIRWFWLRFVAVRRPEDAILLMLVMTVGIHSMLEFPLQYAYFLLPTGLVMGILSVRLGEVRLFEIPRRAFLVLLMVAAVMLGLTFRDYARVDASYSLLRLEQSPLGEGRAPMGGAPDTLVLTQLREWIVLARYKVHPHMSEEETNALVVMTNAYPSLSFAYRLATALALNGRPDEARLWLGKICKFTDEKGCSFAQRSWNRDSKNDPRIALVGWPSI